MAVERSDVEEPKEKTEKKNGGETKVEELTEEDRALQENLDLLVERIVEKDAKQDVQKAALDTIRCVRDRTRKDVHVRKRKPKKRRSRSNERRTAKSSVPPTPTTTTQGWKTVPKGNMHVLTDP